MKRKIIITINIMLLIVVIKLISNTIINNILISKYKKGEYSESEPKMLSYINIIESYIANYNYGNILYQNGKYEEAIGEYKKALNTNIPKNKECSIRINYALAICKTVEVNENSQESIKQAIEKYENAINVLTEKGCANKSDNNGHSQEAEKLKKDIQKEIDRLKKLQKNEENTEKNDDKQEEKSEEKDAIEEKMQEIKEETIREQRKKEQLYNDFNKEYTNIGEKNW